MQGRSRCIQTGVLVVVNSGQKVRLDSMLTVVSLQLLASVQVSYFSHLIRLEQARMVSSCLRTKSKLLLPDGWLFFGAFGASDSIREAVDIPNFDCPFHQSLVYPLMNLVH